MIGYALVAFLFGLWLICRHRRMTLLKRCGIPGPPPNFILGNSVEFASKGTKVCFDEWTRKYGNVVGFYLGGTYHVAVADVDLLREIQIKSFHLFSNRNKFIKGGVHPTADGQNMIVWLEEGWKRLRNALSPAFSSFKLKSMVKDIKDKIEILDATLSAESNDGESEFEIFDHIKRMTLSIMTTCAFSVDLNNLNDKKLYEAFEEAVSPKLDTFLATIQILFPELDDIVCPIRVWWETLKYNMLWAPEGYVLDLARKLLRQRQKSGSTTNHDLMQTMLETRISDKVDASTLEMKTIESEQEPTIALNSSNSKLFTEQEILGNSYVMLIAGYETSSITLAYIFHHLINFPDMQEDIRQEVRDLLRAEGDLDYNVVLNLPILDAFIKETLRMYPPVAPFTSRSSSTNFTFKDMVIPKGAGIFAGVVQLHYNEKFWPNPKNFDPERFKAGSEYEPLAYQPFGAGPRNCIGMRFALLQIKLLLAHLLLKYRFEPGPNSEVGMLQTKEDFGTLLPKNGVKVKLVKLSTHI